VRYAEIIAESEHPPLEGVGFVCYHDETIETAESFLIRMQPENSLPYVAKVRYRITDYDVSTDGYQSYRTDALVVKLHSGQNEIYLRNRNCLVDIEVVKNTLKPARKPIRGKPAKGTPWPARLNSQGIVAHIEKLASTPVDAESMAEFFYAKSAVLKLVRLSDLVEGDPNQNVANARLERKYAGMDPTTAPPLVVSFDGEILDGNHRYRVLKRQGVTEVLAYVVGQ
jgi:hypothetical protein